MADFLPRIGTYILSIKLFFFFFFHILILLNIPSLSKVISWKKHEILNISNLISKYLLGVFLNDIQPISDF